MSMTATQRRERLAFATATADAMRALGAKQTREAGSNGEDALVIFMGRFTIDTIAGPLGVSAYGDAILTRFADARAGERYVGATYPSGKWNFHLWDVGVDSRKGYDRERKLLALFMERLRPILRTWTVAA